MPRRILLVPGLLVALLVALFVPASVARAHTGLERSTPPAGSVVDGPLAEVVLDFTGTPTAIEGGIVVADAAGVQYTPIDIRQDGLRITARFDPALPGGSYTLAWRVRSDDTHVIDGTFSFGVAAPVTSAPATSEPATAGQATPGKGAADHDAASDAAAGVTPPPPPPSSAFGAIDDGETTARFGRMLLVPTAVVAFGMLAFAAWAYAGRSTEIGTLLRLVRWLGVGVALGAVIEVAGLDASFGGFDQVLDQTAGRAALARVVGGVLLVTGFGAVVVARRGASPQSLSAAVRIDPALDEPAIEPAADPGSTGRADGDGRWRPGPRDAAGLLGAGIVLVSFAFDGHTLSKGPRLLHALANIAHVGAASIWAGGLLALAVVLWRRHRDGVAADALRMTLRFSVVAMLSLAVAGAAGVVMALFIDSDVTGYLSTDWGRLLIAKLALVGVAGAIGAHNHFRVLPALEAQPTDAEVLARTRGTVTAEAALLVGAAALTGVLVAASTL